jgi:hypothetical protein
MKKLKMFLLGVCFYAFNLNAMDEKENKELAEKDNTYFAQIYKKHPTLMKTVILGLPFVFAAVANYFKAEDRLKPGEFYIDFDHFGPGNKVLTQRLTQHLFNGN